MPPDFREFPAQGRSKCGRKMFIESLLFFFFHWDLIFAREGVWKPLACQ